MELRQYGRIFWKWLWLIVAGAVVAGGVTYIVSSRSTPIYRASTQLLIQQANNPSGPQWTDVLTSERLAANYARLLTTRPVLNQVAANLRLPEVASSIIVDPVRETQIIVLHVEDPNPALATAVANDLPQVFIAQNEKQQQQRINTTLEAYQTQIDGSQADIEQTQSQLQTFDALENDGEELTLDQQGQRAVSRQVLPSIVARSPSCCAIETTSSVLRPIEATPSRSSSRRSSPPWPCGHASCSIR